MRICFNKDDLIKALEKVGKIAVSQKISPIFSNLKIIADKTILLQVSSLTSFLNLEVQGEIFEEGSICTNAYDFIRTVTNLLGEKVLLNYENKKILEVVSDNCKIKLNVLNNELFEQQTKSQKEILQEFFIDSDALSKITIKCIPFVDSTGIFSGINFRTCDNNELAVSSCTSTNACVYKLKDIDFQKDFESNFILNSKDVIILNSLFKNEPVNVCVYDFSVKFTTGNSFYIVKCLNGKFPPVEKLLPTGDSLELPLHKQELEKIFNLASIDMENPIINISFSNKECCIFNKTFLEVKIPVEYEGDPVTFKFNYELLKNIFKSTSDNILKASYYENKKMILIKEENFIAIMSLVIA